MLDCDIYNTITYAKQTNNCFKTWVLIIYVFFGPFLGDFATTFCSKIGNVFEMLSRYICTCGSAIHILSFSNKCPYLCELPILSRNLRLSRYPIEIVDSSKP